MIRPREAREVKRKMERSTACDCALCRLRAANAELTAARGETRRERARFETLTEEFGEQAANACLPRIAEGVEAAASWASSEAPLAARLRRLLDDAGAHVSALGTIFTDCEDATALFLKHAQDCRDLSRRFRRARAVIHAGRRLELLGHFAVTKTFLRQADAATDLARLQVAMVVGRVRARRRAERTLFETFKARQATNARHVAALEKVFGPLSRRGRPGAADSSSVSWEESRALHDAMARFRSQLREKTQPRADKLRRAAEEQGWRELLPQLAEALDGDRENATALLSDLKKRRGTGASGALAAVAPWRSVVETLHPTPVEEPAVPEPDDELALDAHGEDGAGDEDDEIIDATDNAGEDAKANVRSFCGHCGGIMKSAASPHRCPLCGVEFLYRSDCHCGSRTFWDRGRPAYRCARCGQSTRLVAMIHEEAVDTR